MSSPLGLALPVGRRGQLLAAALTLICLAAIWFGMVTPLAAWYDDREDRLRERALLAAHMTDLAGTLPTLQRALHADAARAVGKDLLLQGRSDSVAGATLQGAVQDLVTDAGATLGSAELLPGEAVGDFRRLGLQVSISDVPWPVLVHLLRSIAEARPRMLVDGFDLRTASATQRQGAGEGRDVSPPLDASFTVYAFRAGPTGGSAQ